MVVLAGPSGSGKTHLAERLGLPVLRLDDYYRDGTDPALPTLELAGGDPIVNWDHPGSWHAEHAIAAIEELCRTGRTSVPSYDLAASRRTGHHTLDLADAELFVAEGIFAHEVVAACRAHGLLADALCVTQHPALTFVRRLTRDLREHRKPPLVLLRRGLHLMAQQRDVVARAAQAGCRVVSPAAAHRAISALM